MDADKIRIMPYTEILVIGGGAAGLEAGLTAAQAGKSVTVITKGDAASPGILGFCAPVSERDSVDCFMRDTAQGGWEIGKPELVRALAEGSLETVKQLEKMGFLFDRDENGAYQLLQPLGCSVPRLVKHGNTTGRESLPVLRKALEALGGEIREKTSALELITEDGRVCGAVCVENDRQAYLQPAGAVVLACGGAHLMKNSTYPLCQTADGFAMAYHAGASLIDLEFVQHEPCRGVWPRPLGLSTTLLAKGGILTNRLGERFVLKYYPTEGAAPKDMLARIIAMEIREGRGTEHGGVWLDLTGIPEEEIRVKHVLYYDRFMGAGIDLTKEKVEVGPAAHSMMGGVEIDENAFTGVPGLYAAGETAGGIHGANRLGGNAGAEVYVFGRLAGGSAAKAEMAPMPSCKALTKAAMILYMDENAPENDFSQDKRNIREVMAGAVGPVRDEQSLKTAINSLIGIRSSLECAVPGDLSAVREKTEALHLCETGLLVCLSALERKESRGVHFRSDYPEMNNQGWNKNIRRNIARDQSTYGEA